MPPHSNAYQIQYCICWLAPPTTPFAVPDTASSRTTLRPAFRVSEAMGAFVADMASIELKMGPPSASSGNPIKAICVGVRRKNKPTSSSRASCTASTREALRSDPTAKLSASSRAPLMRSGTAGSKSPMRLERSLSFGATKSYAARSPRRPGSCSQRYAHSGISCSRTRGHQRSSSGITAMASLGKKGIAWRRSLHNSILAHTTQYSKQGRCSLGEALTRSSVRSAGKPVVTHGSMLTTTTSACSCIPNRASI
mmetsp:Transcript_13650/g.35128  ORF Transcript_13650/g.35128 Transcript_13650/m.35128 type:complete len:253 (+) Transcript_13650:521-1279(+)